MLWLTDSIEAIRDFMELGGPVLRWIAITIFLMWVLIIERLLYFRSSMKTMSADIHDSWEARPERRSWNAHMIREGMISRFSQSTNAVNSYDSDHGGALSAAGSARHSDWHDQGVRGHGSIWIGQRARNGCGRFPGYCADYGGNGWSALGSASCDYT